MWRSGIVLSALVGLTACGDGNPFFDTNESADAGLVLTAQDLNEDLTATTVQYLDNGTATETDDQLVINNLPFDNSDVTGGGYNFKTTLPNGFQVYESPLLGRPNERQYFAVFQRSANAQVTSVGTNDYVDFGFGGVVAERLADGALPAARSESYVFTGQYAGLRIFRADASSAFTAVTGDATLFVDILDFDDVGAVEGLITNRRLYSVEGVFLGDLSDAVSLATGEIDPSNATILPSEAASIENGEALASGQWSGLFAGGEGQEIAGIIVIEGDATATEAAGLGSGTQVRENGAFIVLNTGG